MHLKEYLRSVVCDLINLIFRGIFYGVIVRERSDRIGGVSHVSAHAQLRGELASQQRRQQTGEATFVVLVARPARVDFANILQTYFVQFTFEKKF